MQRLRMMACVSLAKAATTDNQPQIESVATKAGRTESDLGNKIVADILENCYYNIPPELPLHINEMGEDLKITDELKPYAHIDWDTYSKGDFELTEDQKKLIQAFLMLAQQAEEMAPEGQSSQSSSSGSGSSSGKKFTGQEYGKPISLWAFVEYFFGFGNFNMMTLGAYLLAFAVVFGSLTEMYEAANKESRRKKNKSKAE